MKIQLLLAAACTAMLTYLIIKKYATHENNNSFENKSRQGEHHLTNVFAKAKKYSSR